MKQFCVLIQVDEAKFKAIPHTIKNMESDLTVLLVEELKEVGIFVLNVMGIDKETELMHKENEEG